MPNPTEPDSRTDEREKHAFLHPDGAVGERPRGEYPLSELMIVRSDSEYESVAARLTALQEENTRLRKDVGVLIERYRGGEIASHDMIYKKLEEILGNSRTPTSEDTEGEEKP